MTHYVMRSNPQKKKPKLSNREAAFQRKAVEAEFSKKANKHHDDR